MKYLLVLAVVMVAVWIWRKNRLNDAPPPPPPPRRTALRKPTPMVACLHCGTHLPEGEAIQGPRGAYCCEEHRSLHESRTR